MIDDGFLFADFRYSIVHKTVCFPGYFAFVVVVVGAHAAVVAYVVAYVVVVAAVVAVDTVAVAVVVAAADE